MEKKETEVSEIEHILNVSNRYNLIFVVFAALSLTISFCTLLKKQRNG